MEPCNEIIRRAVKINVLAEPFGSGSAHRHSTSEPHWTFMCELFAVKKKNKNPESLRVPSVLFRKFEEKEPTAGEAF